MKAVQRAFSIGCLVMIVAFVVVFLAYVLATSLADDSYEEGRHSVIQELCEQKQYDFCQTKLNPVE